MNNTDTLREGIRQAVFDFSTRTRQGQDKERYRRRRRHVWRKQKESWNEPVKSD